LDHVQKSLPPSRISDAIAKEIPRPNMLRRVVTEVRRYNYGPGMSLRGLLQALLQSRKSGKNDSKLLRQTSLSITQKWAQGQTTQIKLYRGGDPPSGGHVKVASVAEGRMIQITVRTLAPKMA
jgi:hypothetical protein